EATNLVKFAEVVRLLGGAIAADRRDVWRREFFEPEVKALNSTQQQVHNIALWQRCAVAQVALVLGDEALWRGAIDGPWGVRRQMAEGVTSDYFWYEQSLGYNAFVAQAVYALGLAAGLAGRADEISHELAVAQNLLLAPLTLRFPDGRLPNPADSRGSLRAPDPDLLARSYRVFPTTLGLEEARRLRDWNTLLDPPPAPPRPVALPEVASVHLESTRMAVLRAGEWQVFLHYGQLAKSHSQREALNFSAAYRDADVTHDPGTVGYGSPLHRGYYTRGLAHNAPLIDGEGQEGNDRGEVLEFTPTRARAVQPKYRPGVNAARELAIEGGALRDTVTVECADGPRRLGLTFHLQGRTRLPDGFWADTDFARGRPEEFAHWTEVRVGRFKGALEFEVVFAGGTVMRVAVGAPGEFRIWRGSSPDAPPRRRESFYLELTEPASRAVFTTTLVPVSAP
ncbi:MAG: heparinase II/III family protein, partial [Opitutaceae bacterium]